MRITSVCAYVGLDGGTGTLELRSGSLVSPAVSVGERGDGSFLQEGGTVQAETLEIGRGSGGSGLYELRAGQLSGLNAYIGYRAPGAFVQRGGTHTRVMLLLGATTDAAECSSYDLHGGTLHCGLLQVGAGGSRAYLRLLSPQAELTMTGRLILEEGARLEVARGAAVQLLDGALDITPLADELRLRALRHLTVVCTGGGPATGVETAGLDLGPDMTGFHENGGNFALHALHIDADRRGSLLNERVNQGGSAEALYVNTLALGPGSALNLSDRRLYCINMFIDPTATISGLPPQAVLAGDYDDDGDVDTLDWLGFPACWGAPEQELTGECCEFDFDTDGDVDLADFAGFQSTLAGP